MQIGEVALSKGDEMPEPTEIRVQFGDGRATASDFEDEPTSLPGEQLLGEQFDVVPPGRRRSRRRWTRSGLPRPDANRSNPSVDGWPTTTTSTNAR